MIYLFYQLEFNILLLVYLIFQLIHYN